MFIDGGSDSAVSPLCILKVAFIAWILAGEATETSGATDINQ